ncbi:MAG: class I SAM-dependent methyltransferase [Anaerolineae bacterium]|nr:class I SAM-dependent methyltransferase [Anaerolineae bacterium]
MSSAFHVRVESVPCPCGCPPHDQVILTGYDRLHGLPGQYTVVRCRSCGLMRTSPRPTREDIAQYYPADYGPFQTTQIKTQSSAGEAHAPALWKRAAKSLVQFNTTRVPPTKPGRMLEIGCASGRYMDEMAQLGWQVEGIEPDPRAASKAMALGHPVFIGQLESAPDPAEPFDMIVGWMVLEHVHDPALVLMKLALWLRPGGWFVFSVPNAASLERRLFGDAWYALQVPTHLFHYTPASLRTLLGRAGWRIERIFHQRLIGNLMASIGYRLRDYGIGGKASHFFTSFPEASYRQQQIVYPLAFVLSLFGQTGRMTVWARRVDD